MRISDWSSDVCSSDLIIFSCKFNHLTLCNQVFPKTGAGANFNIFKILHEQSFRTEIGKLQGGSQGWWSHDKIGPVCGCRPCLNRCQVFGFLVGERGFEPPAPASRRQCSTRLSYSPTAGIG